ncbi:asparagine synthase (glutamine-hydrolyzing) [Winogradskyella flava]|uniref:asparagine synthase (glutamine-hydrolyzing) n=1 Tax=Winogradskyella flava TaxID=1884876 RepID=A0A842INS3_9FLAO|nr:asparagine synthase (glutamine-hydrolyzing) [Winogradskyella flava]MBC2843859.1 asparagine synthase (glutamine-hydrolyzing) [Winogradskyella flava]
MCGINVIWSKGEITNITERIQKMNSSLRHRGPDATGIYKDQNIVLGHRRLSILDTRELSNQPMHSNDNIWHIVFNGEIYNFEEIKEHLNYNFSTNSDTEVILAAVKEKGIDWFIKQANGMFAIALYNSETKKLYIIRDRLGIKPIFYYNDEENLIFSSEIKAILSSGLVEAVFNEEAVDEYLANRYVRTPFTFFKEIYQLDPGTYLCIDKDFNITKNTYWDIPKAFNMSNQYNEDAILKEFDIELNKAIKYRLISDVPLGTYLSGGVDSSLITAITALNKKEKINTYTIGFQEFNEFEYSNIIAQKYNTEHHEILMQKEDYISNWEKLIKFKDAPLGVPNEIPLAVMSSKLKEKITVVLSGEGADELMGGYGRIYRAPFDYENEAPKIDFYDFFISKYDYVPRSMRDQFISTPTNYRQKYDNELRAEFNKASNEENVFKFFHKYHVKGLLQRVDMTTMQASVEARVPFLDHKLIEFSYRNIPYDLKLKWTSATAKEEARKGNSNKYSEILDIPKYLLRGLSYKYLPREIIERKKVGFPVPLTEWFKNLESLAFELLPKASWLKEGMVNDLIEKSKTESRAGQILWMFINIELFRRNYFQKDWRW